MIRHFENEDRWEVEYVVIDGQKRAGWRWDTPRLVRTFVGPNAELEALKFWAGVQS